VTFGVEHELSGNLSIAADYSYIHGLHLLRPRNINQGNFDLIMSYARAMSVCSALPGVSTNGCTNPIYQGAGGELAGLWDDLGGISPTSLANVGQLRFNQFRATGPNYTWANTISLGLVQTGYGCFGQKVWSPSRSGRSRCSILSVSNSLNPRDLSLPRHDIDAKQALFRDTTSCWVRGLVCTRLTIPPTRRHSEEPQDNHNAKMDRGNSILTSNIAL
jgi:hypothetical protein